MKKLLQNISFTRNEIKVIIFLSAILLVSIGFKLYSIANSDNTAYDYTNEINKFKKLSASINSTSNDIIIDTAELFTSEEISRIRNIQASEDSLYVKKGKKNRKGDNLQPKSININTAGRETLMLLPGVGESTAEKIIVYRNEHGNFSSIEEIMKVKGIGKKKFEKMQEFIYVD